MKFGKNIGSQQESNLQLCYVDYKVLKKRIKDVVARQQAGDLSQALTANTTFEEALNAEIHRVNSCFLDQIRELMDRTASLSDDLEDNSNSAAIRVSSSSAQQTQAEDTSADGTTMLVPRPEPLRRLVDIMKDVAQLRKYAVWNAMAVVKILKKRRKQTSFGIEDVAAERQGWLSRQTFFTGSDFAEMHMATASLAPLVLQSQCMDMMTLPKSLGDQREPQQCPICLETLVDKVELSCGHAFCWKCFVLGPIAFQPSEYRMSQCPICRRETDAVLQDEDKEDGELSILPQTALAKHRPDRELSRLLHTYYPQAIARQGEGRDSDGEGEGCHESEDGDGQDIRDVICQLLQSMNIGPSQSGAAASSSATPALPPSSPAAEKVPDDFFLTLPQKSAEEKKALNQAQKLQWLQLASTGDPLALDDTMYCSLCSEPLLLEAVVTTPCKHYFHRVCVGRLELPECPLCNTALPFSWFLPADHPCVEHGFNVVTTRNYRPCFAGGPSKGSGGYPLHRPPPMSLHGPEGLIMKSYLHRTVPLGGAEDEDEEDRSPTKSNSAASPWVGMSPALTAMEDPKVNDDGTSDAGSESSSDESGSEDGGEEVAVIGAEGSNLGGRGTSSKPRAFYYTALGRMKYCELLASEASGGAGAASSSGAAAASTEAAFSSAAVANRVEVAEDQRNPTVLLIGDHL